MVTFNAQKSAVLEKQAALKAHKQLDRENELRLIENGGDERRKQEEAMLLK